MTKIEEGNRVLAEFMEVDLRTMAVVQDVDSQVLRDCTYEDLDYQENRNTLHEVWVKFRELRFEESELSNSNYQIHDRYCNVICKTMCYGTLPELFEALVEAVRWWNGVKKGGKGE
jgi:hypothetical protein